MKLGLWCLLGVAALPLAACAGEDDPVAEATQSLAATSEGTSVPVADQTIANVMCGDGEVTYYDWRCTAELTYFRGIPVTYYVWELVEVGHLPTLCAPPHTGPLDGTTTNCYTRDELACGGGSDDACYRHYCPIENSPPTTHCP